MRISTDQVVFIYSSLVDLRRTLDEPWTNTSLCVMTDVTVRNSALVVINLYIK